MGHGGRRKRPDSGSKGILAMATPCFLASLCFTVSAHPKCLSHCTAQCLVWHYGHQKCGCLSPTPSWSAPASAGTLASSPQPSTPSSRLTHQESSLPPLRAEAQGPCSPQLSSPASTYFLNVSVRYLTAKGCPKRSAGALPAVRAVPGAGLAATTRV